MADLLYLAGPIDAADPDSHDWLGIVRAIMVNEPGWITYDPWDAFTVGIGTKPDNKIAHLNRVALNKASALIAHLPATHTAGTFMEIALAESMGIPVAWVGDDMWAGHWSLNLRGIERLPTFEEAVSWCLGHARNQRSREEFSTTMRVQKISHYAQLPVRSYPDDAGFDLFCSETATVDPGKWVDISLGVAIQSPPGMWVRIIGRSSTFRKRRLLVIEGTIDEGYRGELFVGVTNLGDEPAHVEIGERIAQMLLGYTHRHVHVEWATELSSSSRGKAGFGSTGS